MIEFIEEHYKIIAGIAVPIIVAILGILKVKTLIKKKNIIKGDDNKVIVADRDIHTRESFNTSNNTVNNSGGAVQVVGDNNQVGNFDIKAIQILAQSFNQTMYPYAEQAFAKLRTNAQNFIASFNSQLEQLSESDREKFSEADVQMVLQKAIQGAAGTASTNVHEILGRLIADRVQKPKGVIAELAINQSIEVAAKLDANLIKILAFSFIFSRTKYTQLLSEDILIQNLSLIVSEFKDLDVSLSRFEYLEAISCGKLSQFQMNDLTQSIVQGYPQLFVKKVSLQQVKELSLPESIQNVCFEKIGNDFLQLNPYVGLYLFEDSSVQVNGQPFFIKDNQVKEHLKNFLSSNRMTEKEIYDGLILKIPEFKTLCNVWKEKSFSRFSLTAVGIAIGRAYLEQKNLGNYDINVWIN